MGDREGFARACARKQQNIFGKAFRYLTLFSAHYFSHRLIIVLFVKFVNACLDFFPQKPYNDCMEKMIQAIGYIENDFTEKFGIPRQSGKAEGVVSRLHFYPPFSAEECFKAIDGFSHLWLLFDFSAAKTESFHATVRPPRLGGNTRVGVFASRSPFRPNGIGLSVVKLLSVEKTAQGICLLVAGADLLNGTPIIDVKPYLPHADCVLGAVGGYADGVAERRLEVSISDELKRKIPDEKLGGLLDCLAEDPRPSYQDEPSRVYGMSFGGYEIKFRVEGDILTVVAVEKI